LLEAKENRIPSDPSNLGIIHRSPFVGGHPVSRLIPFLLTALVTAALLATAYAFAAIDSVARPAPFARLLDANSLAVVVLLLTFALVLFLLERKDAPPSSAWRSLWTCGLGAFLIHLGWTHEGWLLGSPPEVEVNKGELALTAILALWWVVDVALSWGAPSWRAVEPWRGGLHLALFAGLVWGAIVRGDGALRWLGVLMVLATLFALLARVALHRFDPNTLSGRLFVRTFRGVNAVVRWDRFPTWLAVVNLGALREDLRAKNLHDTSAVPVTNPAGVAPVPPFDPKYYSERESDGHYDDLDKVTMGRASHNPADPVKSMEFTQSHPGARFGRNVPLDEAYPDLDHLLVPNPRVVSSQLLARGEFIPAPTLNLLAAAWIQFETHDWFNHGEPVKQGEVEVPIDGPDTWHERPMKVRRTRPDPTRDYPTEEAAAGAQAKKDYSRGDAAKGAKPLPPPPTYVNAESHWWDASQIYGSDPATTERLRRGADGHVLSDGKLAVEGNRLARDPKELEGALSGFTGNWWVGLSLLHTLFAREHNAICDRLRLDYALWSGDQIFAVARMVNAALMAKIHTVEWTPAILARPALRVAMNANWWGLMSEQLNRVLGRLGENEAFGGIPGSGVDHHGADYALTEEFTSVYRMHPLMPDELKVFSLGTGEPLGTFRFPDGVVGPEGTLKVFEDGRTVADVLYSFGLANPGALTLHNFPNFLRQLKRPDGEILDLASIDVFRDRERGVPRYNRFRRLLRLKPIASFDDLRNPRHPDLPAELREVYGRDESGRDRVELLDLMVGMFAEVPPEGFGFSDTAFRIFILMASRRLKSDRFIAQDFTPEVYTPAGHAWVGDNTMVSVLLRHYPALRPVLRGVSNAFEPWRCLWRRDEAGGSPHAIE
jgi:hypothetical protein